MIVRLRATKPNVAEDIIQYVTPKVTRIDDREGVIPIAPADRKSLILEPESTDNFSPARLLEAVFFVFMSLLR